MTRRLALALAVVTTTAAGCARAGLRFEPGAVPIVQPARHSPLLASGLRHLVQSAIGEVAGAAAKKQGLDPRLATAAEVLGAVP